jgi:YjbE family integral membrane protein
LFEWKNSSSTAPVSGAALQIVAIDLLLGGDNAIVIALACRNLPPETRRRGVFWGTVGAVGLRVLLTAFAIALLNVPFLKLIGAALLVWIGVKLMLPDDGNGEHEVKPGDRLMGSIGAIMAADAVMSLDNVLAIAAAARGSVELIFFGLAISIPIIVGASRFVLRLIERFPVVLVLGGGLLGWIALDMAVRDVAVRDWVAAHAAAPARMAPALGTAAVMGIGMLLARRRRRQAAALLEVAGRDRPQ